MKESSLSLDEEPVLPSRGERVGLLDLAIMVVSNIKLLLVVPLFAGLAVLGLTFVIRPTFTAKAVILPPQQQQSIAAVAMQSIGALAGLAGAAAGVKNPVDQYVALLQSAKVSNRIVEAYKLAGVYDAKTGQDARDALASNVRIAAGKKDGLVTVEVDDGDPVRAAAIANSYVDQLRKLTTELAVTEAQQRRVFFEGQLQQTRDRLTAAQRDLQGSGINEGALRAEPVAAANAYASIKAQVTAAEVRLRSMRGYMTENAPEFKVAQSNLSALQMQLVKAEAVDAGASAGDYIGKYREFKYQEALFELFAKQFELAKLDESREGALIQVVDMASPPERKSRPKRALITACTTLAAGFTLLLFVFMRHAFRRAVRGQESAQKVIDLRLAWNKAIGRA
jgi:uncharacterized protein involved in exopolysaccharide biosynthesis